MGTKLRTRREWLGWNTALAATALLDVVPQPAIAATDPLNLPLRVLDPRGPKENYVRYTRDIYYDFVVSKRLTEYLWKTYQQPNHAPLEYDWPLKCAYIWWRAAPTKTLRIKSARIGNRMSEAAIHEHPDKAAGYVFKALFLGAEALSVGVLESLHKVPELSAALDRAIERDPGYLYGIPLSVYGKLYTKLPGFPMSIGDLDKAFDYLERARSYAEGVFAPWYVFYAEATYLRSGADAAFAVIDDMRTQVKPISMETAYLWDAMITDGEALRTAIKTGEYNKYTFDPVLVPAEPTLPTAVLLGT